jgi:hypothetical protein
LLGGANVAYGVAGVALTDQLSLLLVAGAQAVLGTLLAVSTVGIATGRPWGRWAGVVGFLGSVVVQLLPTLALGVVAAPPAVLGIGWALLAGLYLLFAGTAFEDRDRERQVRTGATDPLDYRRSR